MTKLITSFSLLTMIATIAHAAEIIAHRGASYDAPENTLAAVRLAWEQKADAVEIDVHLTSDKQIVVLHDSNTKRTTGVDSVVAERRLSELRALDAGQWKDTRFSGEKIPTLDEVIATIPEGKRLVIEVKCGPEIIPALIKALAGSNKPNAQFAIISFSYEVMVEVKKALPEVEAYWLAAFRRDGATQKMLPALDELIRTGTAAKIDGFSLHYEGPIDAAFVRQLREAGLKCYVWTVDSPDVARNMLAAGVDGITTNRPEWLREHLQIK